VDEIKDAGASKQQKIPQISDKITSSGGKGKEK
jgi:hypothetical protein